jgi:hypothetical protein
MLVAVLHMLRDAEDPQGVVDRFLAAVPAGSYLVISHLASDVQQDAMAEMGRRLNQSMTQQFTMRARAQQGLPQGLRTDAAAGDQPRPTRARSGGCRTVRPAGDRVANRCSLAEDRAVR